MKSRRAITIGLTFIAGLYFILDFVVPPTMPGISSQGIALKTEPATFQVQSPSGSPIEYRMAAQGAMRPRILLAQRDILGKPKMTPALLRQIGVGATVTVRCGPFAVGKVLSASDLLDGDGHEWRLAAGQRWVDGTSDTVVMNPASGTTLVLEQFDGRLIAKDPGKIEMLVKGKRVLKSLGNRSAVIKLSRAGSGSEVSLDEVRTGDTVQIGPSTTFADNRDAAAQFNLVITTMAFGIGLLSLGMAQGTLLVKRRKGWYLSIFFFASVALGVAAGIGKYEEPGTQARVFSDFIILKIISSVTSAVFSLLAFYMAAAAYRAFRVKTLEAGLMMASALIVMLGQTPFGSYLTSWMGERFSALWLPNIAAWILRVPNTAVFRGLIFGIMMGAIATALRYWLSMEKTVSAGD